jgi:hypothetical protein
MLCKTDKQNRDALLKLLLENPNIPVRVIVDEEVVTGEYSTYLAYVFDVCKKRYTYYSDRFYDDEDELFDDWFYTVAGADDATEEELRPKFEEEFRGKWEEAIFIHASV